MKHGGIFAEVEMYLWEWYCNHGPSLDKRFDAATLAKKLGCSGSKAEAVLSHFEQKRVVKRYGDSYSLQRCPGYSLPIGFDGEYLASARQVFEKLRSHSVGERVTYDGLAKEVGLDERVVATVLMELVGMRILKEEKPIGVYRIVNLKKEPFYM